MTKKKKVLGYIVYSRFGVHGLGSEDLLWLGGSNFSVTLFKSRVSAKQAIRRTEKTAREDFGYNKDTHPCWFDHSISTVTGEK